MLDIKWIRDNAAALDAALAKRGASTLAKALIDLDERRRSVIQKAQTMPMKPNMIYHFPMVGWSRTVPARRVSKGTRKSRPVTT